VSQCSKNLQGRRPCISFAPFRPEGWIEHISFCSLWRLRCSCVCGCRWLWPMRTITALMLDPALRHLPRQTQVGVCLQFIVHLSACRRIYGCIGVPVQRTSDSIALAQSYRSELLCANKQIDQPDKFGIMFAWRHLQRSAAACRVWRQLGKGTCSDAHQWLLKYVATHAA
jgi:hypothetical protein